MIISEGTLDEFDSRLHAIGIGCDKFRNVELEEAVASLAF